MNDYKELIENLRSNTNNVFQQQAADTIEQLVRERDAAIKDLKYLPFTTCKWVNTDRCKNSCLCERYEWRGVKENIGNGEVLNETRRT